MFVLLKRLLLLFQKLVLEYKHPCQCQVMSIKFAVALRYIKDKYEETKKKETEKKGKNQKLSVNQHQ